MTLHLTTPAIVTVRALSTALDRALGRRGSRLDLARSLGIGQPDVTRATDPRQGDTVSLARVAAAAGYERHPTMPGHYRRVDSIRTAHPVEA